jgi:hypothetical protein
LNAEEFEELDREVKWGWPVREFHARPSKLSNPATKTIEQPSPEGEGFTVD